MEEFQNRLNGVGEKHLFNVIEREKWTGFESENMKVSVKVDGKAKAVTVQKDIFALLAAKSDKDFTAVDMTDALRFPLAPVSLPLATPDGGMRKTNKSKLYDVLNMEQVSSTVINENEGHYHYILDLAAKLRTITSAPKTFEDLGMKILREIPNKYNSLYIACDTYQDDSIKQNERNSRTAGKTAAKLLVKSAKVRVPSNFQQFLNNGENKERVFELIESIIIEKASMLSDKEMFFARKDKCIKISRDGVQDEFTLRHEEADTKVTFLAVYAGSINRKRDDDLITVRSYSGDIDIPVIMIGNLVTGNIFLDNGTSKDRKIFSVSKSNLTNVQKKAVLGLHAFSGNDQNSSFLRKGKVKCWKTAQRHLDAFAELGRSYSVSNQLQEKIEKLVLYLYGCASMPSVDEARSKIFWDNLRKKKRIVDLAMLPPCRASLNLHLQRSNYIARIWRQASLGEMHEVSALLHGWNPDYTLKWEAVVYPEYVYDLLQQSSPINDEAEEIEDDEDDEFEDQEASVFGEDHV